MADDAREYSDKELKKIERELSMIYRKSQRELTEEWNQYMRRTEERVNALWFAYQNASDEERAEALKRYQDAVQNQTLHSKWYRDMINHVTLLLAKVNQTAADHINVRLPEIYNINYQQIARELISSDFYPTMQSAFDIRSMDTITKLAKGEIMLPGMDNTKNLKRNINVKKDMLWNSRQINSSVLQGVLQGESIRDITKRLMPIVGNNQKSAVRAARTMVTAAENAGRLDSYSRIESMGAVIHKVWIATPDKRVRDWHLSMDGQEVEKDKPFTDGNGDKLMYPGDPSAPGRTVWNCRCSMRSQIVGFRRADGSIEPMKRFEHEGLHQEQIEKERRARNG